MKQTAILLGSTLLLCLVSCKTTKEIQTLTDTVAVHDTTYVELLDTLKIVEVKYDSIDRFVEKIIYTDTNGVIHEKEVERLYHYARNQEQVYQKTIDKLRSYVSYLEKQLKQEKTVVEVKKPLCWWQKTMIYIGAAAILGFVLYIIYMIIRRSYRL